MVIRTKEKAKIKPPPRAEGLISTIPGCLCLPGSVTIPLSTMSSITFLAISIESNADVANKSAILRRSGFISGSKGTDPIVINLIDAAKSVIQNAIRNISTVSLPYLIWY
jgi:hypothetical protein